MLSTAISTTTKTNISLSARSLGTSSRILVIIQISCRSINTPSSGPTAPSFLNVIAWAATGQTLDILNKVLKALRNYLLGFFPLLLMISQGPVWNYQQSEDHYPVKPWLRLPVVSLFAPGTINEMPVFLPTVSRLVY